MSDVYAQLDRAHLVARLKASEAEVARLRGKLQGLYRSLDGAKRKADDHRRLRDDAVHELRQAKARIVQLAEDRKT